VGSKLKWIVLVPIAVFALWATYHVYQLDYGKRTFARLGCASCHFSGGGPNLANILPQYDEQTVEDFIRDPEAVYRRLDSGFAIMHKVNTTDSEVRAMAKYLKSW